jgi:hypothetical protein
VPRSSQGTPAEGSPLPLPLPRHVGLNFLLSFLHHRKFSGGVTEKYLSTEWAQTFDLHIGKQIFYHCATATLCTISYDIHCVPSWDFPAISVCSYRKPNFPAVSGSYLPGFSGRICSYWQPNFPAVSGSYLPGFSGRICSYWQPNFLAVSVVTCQDFLSLPFLAPEGRDFPAVSVVSGRDFPAVAFLAWVI